MKIMLIISIKKKKEINEINIKELKDDNNTELIFA